MFFIYITLSPTFATSTALNQIPSTRQLQHIIQLDNLPALTNAPHISNSATQPCYQVLLGAEILSIPPKLAKKITEGHYVDMAEFCPEHLEALNAVNDH